MRIRCFSAVEPGWSYYRDLLPYLVQRGHRVEIIITDSTYRDQIGGSFTASMRERGVGVRVVDLGRRRAGQGRRRIALYVRYVLAAMRKSLFGSAVDVNLFLTQPPLFFLWGLALKALRGQRYAVVLMDLYPDVLTASGMMRPSALHIRLAGWLARIGHRNADALIAIGRCTEARMVAEGVAPERIHLAPNWSNAAVRPVPRDANPLRDQLGLGGRFVVMYSGNMGLAHHFQDILEVARRLGNDDRVRFVFAGDGQRRGELERAREELGLSNVVLLPFQPAEGLALSLGLGDVHFVSLHDGFEGLVVPSKAYSILDAGRGIVYQGSRDGEVARLVEEEGIGAVVAIGDVGGLETTLRRAVANPDLVRTWGERARHLAEGRYSRDSALARYAAAFAALEAGPRT